jgi:threonine dehydrogenase-like Zn-dependent dehydrogenase
VVRLLRATVDGLDLEIARGLFDHRGVLGRSCVGVVESVEGATSRGLIRKRAVVAPMSACGKCDLCVAGLAAQCREQSIMGVMGRDGCLMERFTAPAANLTAVPDDVDDDHAVFASLVASAIHTSRQLALKSDSFVTVLGDGRLGLLLVQVLRRSIESVRLIGRYSEKLALAERRDWIWRCSWCGRGE